MEIKLILPEDIDRERSILSITFVEDIDYSPTMRIATDLRNCTSDVIDLREDAKIYGRNS